MRIGIIGGGVIARLFLEQAVITIPRQSRRYSGLWPPQKGADRNPTSKGPLEQTLAIVKEDSKCQWEYSRRC